MVVASRMKVDHSSTSGKPVGVSHLYKFFVRVVGHLSGAWSSVMKSSLIVTGHADCLVMIKNDSQVAIFFLQSEV